MVPKEVLRTGGGGGNGAAVMVPGQAYATGILIQQILSCIKNSTIWALHPSEKGLHCAHKD